MGFVEYYGKTGDVGFYKGLSPHPEDHHNYLDGYCGATTYVFAPSTNHSVPSMIACNSSVMLVPTLTFEGEI